MSWIIFADVREIFAEIKVMDPKANNDGGHLFIRSYNRKDQMLEGLTQALRTLQSQTSFQGFENYQIQYRSDIAETQLRERWFPSIGLICTEGFQNILETGLQQRTKTFTLNSFKEKSLIEKDHCFGITERIGHDGKIIRSFNKDEVETIVAKFKLSQITDVVISLMHANKNPAHEVELAKVLKDKGFNVYAAHQLPGNEFNRTVQAVKNLVQEKSKQEITQKLIEMGFKAESIKEAESSNHQVFVFENKILVNGQALPLSPLSPVFVDHNGVPQIKYKSIDSEPGPVAFGKGVEITCLDLLFYKNQLQYADSLKRVKIDLNRVKKYLLLLAQQMRTDVDTAIERFLFLFHKLIQIELDGKISAETQFVGELAPYIFTDFNHFLTTTYVTQIGQLTK